jgi:hypothetical protein
MITLLILTHLGVFLLGIVGGAAGQYYAQWGTEQRQKREAAKKRDREWASIVARMPKLIDEMHADWIKEEHRDWRFFYAAPRAQMANSNLSGAGLVYDVETHELLEHYLGTLREFGLIQAVEQQDAVIKFQVSDEFVARIREHRPAPRVCDNLQAAK